MTREEAEAREKRGSCGIGPHDAAPAGTLSVEETHVPTTVLGSEAPA